MTCPRCGEESIPGSPACLRCGLLLPVEASQAAAVSGPVFTGPPMSASPTAAASVPSGGDDRTVLQRISDMEVSPRAHLLIGVSIVMLFVLAAALIILTEGRDQATRIADIGVTVENKGLRLALALTDNEDDYLPADGLAQITLLGRDSWGREASLYTHATEVKRSHFKRMVFDGSGQEHLACDLGLVHYNASAGYVRRVRIQFTRSDGESFEKTVELFEDIPWESLWY